MNATDCEFDAHVKLTGIDEGDARDEASASMDWLVGLDDEGFKIRMSLDNEPPHLLIAGSSKSGKSTVLHSFLLQMMDTNTPDQITFRCLEPKNELQRYAGIAHIKSLEDSMTMLDGPYRAAVRLFDEVMHELDRRWLSLYDNLPEHASENPLAGSAHRLPRICVVIEECSTFFAVPGQGTGRDGLDFVNRSAHTYLMAMVSRVARFGQAVGIHMVLTSQDANVLPGTITRECQVIGLSVPDLMSSVNLIGRSGLEKFPRRAGRFIANDGQGGAFEGAPFRISDESLREHLGHLPIAA